MKMEGNVLQVVAHRMEKKKCLMLKINEVRKNKYYNIQSREKKSKKIREGVNLICIPFFVQLID